MFGFKQDGHVLGVQVLFGVSRAIGVLSALCWSRGLGLPIERPKSVTMGVLENKFKQSAGG